MAPISIPSVQEKLLKLEHHIQKLERLSAYPQYEFLSNIDIADSASYSCILGIEIICDIGNHILAEQYKAPAKTYRDVILSLGKYGVIDSIFASDNQRMADFRNKLIHDYDSVNSELLFAYIKKAPEIFRQFASAFATVIQKEKTK